MRTWGALVLLLGAVGLGACGFQANEAGETTQEITIGFLGGASLQDELSGQVLVPIALSAIAPDLVSVHYRFTGGDANNGTDYVGSDNLLTIPPGATEATIPLTILQDAMEENSETIELTLSDPTNALLGVSKHTITISSNILPRVTFTTDVSNDMEAVSPTLAIELTMSSQDTVSVDYVVSGTAQSGADFTLTGGTVTFPPGVTSKELALPIIDDALDEFDESVLVTMTNSSNVVVGIRASHEHAIIDDDLQPTVSFAAATQAKAENTNTVDLVIQLSAPSGKPIMVNVVPGTAPTIAASSGVDFTFPATTTLMFAPGQTQQTFTVTLIDDTTDEFDEGFAAALTVQLGDNVDLGPTASDVVTITDNDNPPTVQFTTATAQVDEGSSGPTSYPYAVTLSAASAKPITIPITFAGSEATDPGDYSVTGNPIQIAPGETTGAVTLVVVGDTVRETASGGTKRIDLAIAANNVLTNVARAGANITRTLTIRDDD